MGRRQSAFLLFQPSTLIHLLLELRPPPDVPKKGAPKHRQHSPPHLTNTLTYSRRLEGLLEPSEGPALQDVEPTSPHRPIPKLAHGLDRVLFKLVSVPCVLSASQRSCSPGVHWLQDPRSRVYNFSPYLENIPKVTDFAFERLVGFVKSSRDEVSLSYSSRIRFS